MTDHLTPDAIENLVEELGLEFDSAEHEVLERGPLCQPSAGRGLKRTGVAAGAGASGLVKSGGVNH